MEVEAIVEAGTILAYIVRNGEEVEATKFVTPDEALQQVGFIAHPAGTEIERHHHHPLERRIVGTPEVLIVRRGRCEIDVYDDEKQLHCTRELSAGDVMVMISGGHGFRMVEDTVLLEVKQGPYFGPAEKSNF